MKRTVSIFLAMLLIATLFASFGTVSAAASKKITSTNPVITANVGEKITLSDYSVVFDGESGADSLIKWAKEDGTLIREITPDKKGVTKLIVSSRTKAASTQGPIRRKEQTPQQRDG